MLQGARHVGKDIAGKGIANPCAALLSAAMLLRHINLPDFSDRCLPAAVLSPVCATEIKLSSACTGHQGEPETCLDALLQNCPALCDLTAWSCFALTTCACATSGWKGLCWTPWQKNRQKSRHQISRALEQPGPSLMLSKSAWNETYVLFSCLAACRGQVPLPANRADLPLDYTQLPFFVLL